MLRNPRADSTTSAVHPAPLTSQDSTFQSFIPLPVYFTVTLFSARLPSGTIPKSIKPGADTLTSSRPAAVSFNSAVLTYTGPPSAPRSECPSPTVTSIRLVAGPLNRAVFMVTVNSPLSFGWSTLFGGNAFRQPHSTRTSTTCMGTS